MKNWPDLVRSRSSRRPRSTIENALGVSATTSSTTSWCRHDTHSGTRDPPDQDSGERAEVQAPPEHLGPGLVEVGAVEDLVRQHQRHPEVGVEVDQVPGLIAQPASGDLDRGHHHRDDHQRADRRPQHPRVGDEQLPQRPGPLRGFALDPVEREQRGVDDRQPERHVAQPLVPAGQHVVPPGLLDPRDPGHEQHHQDHQHLRQQPGVERLGLQQVLRVHERLEQPAVPGPDPRRHHHRGDRQQTHQIGDQLRQPGILGTSGRMLDRGDVRHANHNRGQACDPAKSSLDGSPACGFPLPRSRAFPKRGSNGQRPRASGLIPGMPIATSMARRYSRHSSACDRPEHALDVEHDLSKQTREVRLVAMEIAPEVDPRSHARVGVAKVVRDAGDGHAGFIQQCGHGAAERVRDGPLEAGPARLVYRAGA